MVRIPCNDGEQSPPPQAITVDRNRTVSLHCYIVRVRVFGLRALCVCRHFCGTRVAVDYCTLRAIVRQLHHGTVADAVISLPERVSLSAKSGRSEYFLTRTFVSGRSLLFVIPFPPSVLVVRKFDHLFLLLLYIYIYTHM